MKSIYTVRRAKDSVSKQFTTSNNSQSGEQHDSELPGSEPEVVNICQLRSASQFSLAIQVDDKPIRAVVDSAAEVNIISDRIYQYIGSPPHKVKYVTWEKHLIGKILCCWIQKYQTLH